MGQAIEQTLAAGFKETFDRCGIQGGIGWRHGFGHQGNNELGAGNVLGWQVGGGNPVVQLLAPGQIALHIAAIQRVLRPGRIAKALVIRGWGNVRTTEHDIFDRKAQTANMFEAVDRLLDGLTQYQTCRGNQIPGRCADDRIGAKNVITGLLAEFFVFFVGHRLKLHN